MSKKDKKKKKNKKDKKKKKSIGRRKFEKLQKKMKVKGTIDKKEVKRMRKALEKANEIPAITEAREVCNCNGKKGKPNRLTVAEFKQLGYPLLNADIDSFVEVFGAEHVMVCGDCFEPIVPYAVISRTAVTPDKMPIVARAMKNVVVSREDDRKAVKKISRSINSVANELLALNRKYHKAVKKIQKIESKTTGSEKGNFVKPSDKNFANVE